MATTKVTADTAYEPVPFHFKVPHGIFVHEGTAIACDSEDNVYVFNRGNVPVLVFDSDGNLLRHWGNETPFEGVEEFVDAYGFPSMRWKGRDFLWPHGITIDHEDNVWLVDVGAHSVVKCDKYGKRLMMMLPHGKVLIDPAAMEEAKGAPVEAAEVQSGEPFNKPTHVAIHPVSGDIFVSDGYGNSRVHRFKADGSHVCSWGRSGTDPGEFNLPHCIAIHPDGDKVMVADRENSKVQIFTLDGDYVDFVYAHRAVAVCTDRPVGRAAGDGADASILIAEQGTASRVQRGKGPDAMEYDTWTKRIGHRITFHQGADNAKVNAIGAELPGERPEQFNWLHAVTVDSKGSIYVAEVSFVECGRHQKPHAREMVSLRKWRRVAGDAAASASAGARK